MWPHVYEQGLSRLKNIFGLEPLEFPTTKKLGASKTERSNDLIAAFINPEIKAVISTLGGDDQVTYIKNLPAEPFVKNPKPFFGFSDNTHFMNFLWLNGVPSYYGGALFTQLAEQGNINSFTQKYLNLALFSSNEVQLDSSHKYSDISLDWNDSKTLDQNRVYEENDGWKWDGTNTAQGLTWGGCLESIDEILRHGLKIPTLSQFEKVVLITETSEEIPTPGYVKRVYRALGERGILEKIQGILVGRPKAWEFNNQNSAQEKRNYRQKQVDIIVKTVREYNNKIPIIQNLDFGHTEPQIPFPYGMAVKIDSSNKSITIQF